MAFPLALIGPVVGLAKFVAGGVKDYFTKKEEIRKEKQQAEIEISKLKQEQKIEKQRGKLELLKAKSERVTNRQLSEQELMKIQLKQSGWKDEYWTLIISIPLILVFIPGFDSYILRGFAALGETPIWYQGLMILVILSPFGYRITDALLKFLGKK